MVSLVSHIGEYEEKKEDLASYQERLEQWMMLNKLQTIKSVGALFQS